MKKKGTHQASTAPGQRLSFHSKLICLAPGMNYFAVSVPVSVTRALKTKGPVPVSAQVNGSEIFVASLYPVGGGRHYLRIKNKICKAVKVTEGSRVEVKITVRDRSAEISIPQDLMRALREEHVVDSFKALPIGKKSFILRLIDQAAKPETREKRIQSAVDEACRRLKRRRERK